MTSKISSGKLLKESIRRNMALGVLILVGFFCYFPLGGSLLLRSFGQMTATGMERTNDYLHALGLFGSTNPALFIVTFCFAFLLGILQFSYLHSQRKLDLYHSIPVRREKLFAIQYLAGILLWLAPFAAGSFLYWISCELSGFGAGLAPVLLRGLLAHIACFLLVYSLTILCMMLTGKIFTAICGMVVFCGYLPAVKLVQKMLMEYYFSTYYVGIRQHVSMFYKGTPVYAFIRICSEMMEQTFPKDLLLALVLISALLAALSVWLYRRRGSEKAGSSMVFPAVARIVKFIIVVPAVLMIATTLDALAEQSLFWGLIGWALGLLLVSGFMEFLYVLDIREIFRDRKQLIFTGIVTLAILAAFQYDLIGYNRWLPDPSEVESISMTDINNFTDMRFVNEYEECSRSADGQSVQYKMHVRKELDNQYTFTQDRLEDAYALIRHSIPFTEGKMKQYFPEDDEQIWYRGGTMIFRMKDGSTKYRSYIFREQELLTYLVPIWESDEYKEKVYPILQVKPEQVINVVAARDRWSFDGGIVEEELPAKDAASGTVKVEAKTIRSETAASETVGPEEETLQEDEEIRPDNPLTSAQKKEILETLQKDLREEKLSLFPDYDYVINVVYHGTDGKVYGEEYCLSADFQDTLNVLKDCGFELK